MEDLDENPLFRALMTTFRREFELACRMSYVIAIPQSDTLEALKMDQTFVNSHILMPSRLLKMHYTPLQAGYFEDIEIDERKLICRSGRRSTDKRIEVTILAQEIGYNLRNKEYRTLLLDKPLVAIEAQPVMRILSPLSSKLVKSSSRRFRPPRSLACHKDCLRYLDSISQEITMNLESEVKSLQSHYMILSSYLDDAAQRIKFLAESYSPKYVANLESRGRICENVRRAIRVSVESYIIHLLHGKLISIIHDLYEKEDARLSERFHRIHKAKLTICQLGAQTFFEDFVLDEKVIGGIRELPMLQSPLAVVSSLMKIIETISESLNNSVKFRQLLGHECQVGEKVSICSDDLIATLVFSLSKAKPCYLYSMSRYLETFGWSSNASDQAAYYTATLQIVIQYIFNYTSEDSFSPQVSAIHKLSSLRDVREETVSFADSIDSESSTNPSSDSGIVLTIGQSKAGWELL